MTKINTINVKKHLKGIQVKADTTCEKSILNKFNVFSKRSQCNFNELNRNSKKTTKTN